MCGIFGTITNDDIENTLIDGLRHIEYRGYDSCGMSVIESNTLMTHKAIGEIDNLKSIIKDHHSKTAGIAHTRWATNGIVSLENTHPFISQNKKIALVHNGIIENVDELKSTLKHTKFLSSTDSEVMAHLLEDQNLLNLDFIDTFKNIKGSYAVCFINSDIPNTIFVAKKHCPLYVAKNKDNNSMYVASDPICFSGKCEYYYSLDDNEYGIISEGEIALFDSLKNPIIKEKLYLDIDKDYLSTKTHKTYMEKEIYEIPKVIDTVNNYDTTNFGKIKNIINTNNISRICLIACGTAYHSCIIGASYLRQELDIATEVYISSEYLYDNIKIDKNTLHIFVSQSGETADTLSCLKLIKEHNLPTIAITNANHSSIVKYATISLCTNAKKEFAVASTKTYIAQIVMFFRLSKYLSNKDSYLPIKSLKIDYFDHSKELIKILNSYKKVFLLGKNNDYATAQEASLKLRETCYIPCFAMSIGELKHGTLALIDESSVCLVISTNEKIKDKIASSINEIQSRGGHIILIASHSVTNTIKPIDYKINLLSATTSEIESIIPMQLLANAYSLSLGLNPDKPRNLAKSVTVE
ncbi:MAG: glutamine--fructose-6-phosphate transaminase (isomerizing) [Clostridia bacterium]|nr:glutamine--fructose-6-phosphate transaminase (isomerizing) [Clostridia bacterium]